MNPTITVITTESDMHGELCSWCGDDDAFCVTNIYVTDAHSDRDMAHSCAECVAKAIRYRHFGDTDPHVEISTAPLPHDDAATPELAMVAA